MGDTKHETNMCIIFHILGVWTGTFAMGGARSQGARITDWLSRKMAEDSWWVHCRIVWFEETLQYKNLGIYLTFPKLSSLHSGNALIDQSWLETKNSTLGFRFSIFQFSVSSQKIARHGKHMMRHSLYNSFTLVAHWALPAGLRERTRRHFGRMLWTPNACQAKTAHGSVEDHLDFAGRLSNSNQWQWMSTEFRDRNLVLLLSPRRWDLRCFDQINLSSYSYLWSNHHHPDMVLCWPQKLTSFWSFAWELWLWRLWSRQFFRE